MGSFCSYFFKNSGTFYFWDREGLMKALSKNINKVLHPHGEIGCTIGEKVYLKKGDKSAGAARQYAGCSDKVDKVRQGGYLSLTAYKYSCITNFRLYLPQVWTSNDIFHLVY